MAQASLKNFRKIVLQRYRFRRPCFELAVAEAFFSLEPTGATQHLSTSPNLQMSRFRISERATRVLAVAFFFTTAGLGVALTWSWMFFNKLALRTIAGPELPAHMRISTEPVSPLQIQYQLDLPGRGEIFPALYGSKVADYWPVAVLNVANTSARPVLQIITAQVRGWSGELRQTIVVPPHQIRTLRFEPVLLPQAYQNSEIHQATLVVEAKDAATGHVFAQQRPVFLHSASDLYRGRKFAN